MASDAKDVFPGHFKVQWSETMHMLDLSANQLDLTIQEGNESVELLMNTFDSLTEHLESLEHKLNKAIPPEAPTADAGEISPECRITKEKVNQAVVGLQFYDRLTQRLQHIRESLAVLSALIDDPNKQNIPEEWTILRNKIKTKYSTEQQKSIFHALMRGADIDEVFEFFDD